ncbi:tissue factor pathway inhibitor 2-like [Spodoptera litura]|uniref:Tissue factor pathway inhibitor 2-like n=1 Tax=Spodoptera litura TaxID=69820 RepID=A0A9J7IN88_SPOLT|nr:tissue factor pathway inhibitor 2-like [Spodoptera litura]
MAFNLNLLFLFAFITFVGFSVQQQTNSTICSMAPSFGVCDEESDDNSTEAVNVTTTTRTITLRYGFRNFTCVPFLYSGCGGNANNFMSYEACREVCGGPTLGR